MRLIQRLNEDHTKWLLDVHRRFPNSYTDVWLSTAYGYPTLEKHKELAECLAKSAKAFEEQGVRVSLQLSNTIGHGQYMASKDCSALQKELKNATRLVGHDGTIAEYSFCWRDETFLAYVEEQIGLYVKSIAPKEVWLDDDLRANNHSPVKYGCFCDKCIAKFNQEYGYQYDRETIVKLLKDASNPLKLDWIAFLQEGLAVFTERICSKIVSIKEGVQIGLQNGPNGHYAGFGYDYLLDAIRRVTKTPPMYRAGAGVYHDYNPYALVEKAYCLAYQYAILPEYVETYCAEIENSPNTAMGKTMYGTALEASLNFALGATDCSFAMLGVLPEEAEFYEKGFRLFEACSTYWKKLTELTNESYASGIWFVHAKQPHLSNIDIDDSYARINELLRCGLPISHKRNGCDVALLHPEIARQMQKEELEELMKCCVLTDVATVSYIQQQGLDLGFKTRPMLAEDSVHYREVFTEHPINKYQNRSFKTGYFTSGFGGYELIEEYPDSGEVLGRYSKDGQLCEVSDVVFTTAQGGRWAVIGYGLWKSNIPSIQRKRIQDIIEYINPMASSARILSDLQMLLIPRIHKMNGKISSVSVVNCTIEQQENVQIRIKQPYGEEFFLHSREKTYEVLDYEEDGDAVIITIPVIKPWDVMTVEIKRKGENHV